MTDNTTVQEEVAPNLEQTIQGMKDANERSVSSGGAALYSDQDFANVVKEFENKEKKEKSVDDTSTTEIKGCTNPSAINYDSTATVDDGSCEFQADQLADVTIEQYKFIDYSNVFVQEKKKLYDEHLSLIDLDKEKGIDPKFKKNIENADVQYQKDRRGNFIP